MTRKSVATVAVLVASAAVLTVCAVVLVRDGLRTQRADLSSSPVRSARSVSSRADAAGALATSAASRQLGAASLRRMSDNPFDALVRARQLQRREAVLERSSTEYAVLPGVVVRSARVANPSGVPGRPIAMRIPALGLDAVVSSVGKNPDETMEVPRRREAGWYRPGVRPGAATGSAVIAGHVDLSKEPGVFADLRNVAVGDDVDVVDEFGAVLRYVVSERFQVGKEDLPVDDLFRSDGPHVLTLITCGGRFDRRARHYEDNVVIRAVPVSTVERREARSDR
jgi:LPXTG-site transpeptidase (sortase) family protein